MLWDLISVMPSWWSVGALGEQSCSHADGVGALPVVWRSLGVQSSDALYNMGCPVFTAQIPILIWRDDKPRLSCTLLQHVKSHMCDAILPCHSTPKALGLKTLHERKCMSLGLLNIYCLTALLNSPPAGSASSCLSKALFPMWGLASQLVFQLSFFQKKEKEVRDRRQAPCPLRSWVGKVLVEHPQCHVRRGKSKLFFQRLPWLLSTGQGGQQPCWGWVSPVSWDSTKVEAMQTEKEHGKPC